ncbi:glycoside hydrolase TIM-barrel-like domain-containing protein [Paracoccus marcusii]|nr:glycoside hydrolase TIM-barrel-like domain-containing protein [Paracoccus marcusii]
MAAFFGSAAPTDFARIGETVTYSGPAEWSYRRFILHYAHVCAAAGGIDAF